jgi:hypothetical protein
MAVRRPKPRRRKATTHHSSPPSMHQPTTSICKPRMLNRWKRPRETTKLDLYLPGPPPILVLPGRQRLAQQRLRRSSSICRMEPGQMDDGPVFPFSDSIHFSNDAGPRRLTSSQKRANQWRRWSEDVIPRMIVPYLSYLQETVSLRHANMPAIRHWTDGECRTGCKTRSIKVACMFFDGILSFFSLLT